VDEIFELGVGEIGIPLVDFGVVDLVIDLNGESGGSLSIHSFDKIVHAVNTVHCP